MRAARAPMPEPEAVDAQAGAARRGRLLAFLEGLDVATGLFRPASEGQHGTVHDIRPHDAGWTWVGFTEHRLERGEGIERPSDDKEVAAIVVDGAVTLEAAGQRWSSVGSRSSLFEGPPAPVLLTAPGTSLVVEAESPTTLVIADAPAGEQGWTRLIAPEDVLVETRGRGSTERPSPCPSRKA